jgi:hypothetical protein
MRGFVLSLLGLNRRLHLLKKANHTLDWVRVRLNLTCGSASHAQGNKDLARSHLDNFNTLE